MIPLILVSNSSETTNLYLENFISKNKFSKERVFEIIPPKKEIVISQIKEIINKMVFASNLPKLFIFFNFDTAGAESQNALLKSLEENSPNNQFIFVVDNEHSLFSTIRSRSKVIKLKTNKNEISNLQALLILIKKIESAGNYSFLHDSTVKNTDKEQVLQNLDKLLLIYKSKLSADPRSTKVIKKIFQLRSLLLSNNINPQLAYDNLLIFIYKAFRMKL